MTMRQNHSKLLSEPKWGRSPYVPLALCTRGTACEAIARGHLRPVLRPDVRSFIIRRGWL